ncbi:Uncharacterised protein [[Ruminococcus] torques]|nr:Uncharacterised protein [[Ruminococcus] torques]
MLSDDGAVGGVDESKAKSNGAVEVGEPNAVGWNDEQYPALCGRSGVERYSLCVIDRAVFGLPF